MLYHSEGGFTHDDVYCMPVYLIKFYLRELESSKETERKAYDKARKKSSSTTVHRPNITK